MRDFFKSEFKTLKLKTGLNQYENLCALEDAEQQIKLLLDMLVRVCDDFNYIPEPDKKRIIQEGIYRDTEFTKLVPRVVWKWLNAQSAKYFKEAAHIKPEEEAPPVAYDDLNPKLKAEVDSFIKMLQMDNGGLKSVPEVSQVEIDRIKNEDEFIQTRKAITVGHKTKMLRIDYIEGVLKPNNLKHLITAHEQKPPKDWVINNNVEGHIIVAKDLQEAQEIFTEVYL